MIPRKRNSIKGNADLNWELLEIHESIARIAHFLITGVPQSPFEVSPHVHRCTQSQLRF